MKTELNLLEKNDFNFFLKDTTCDSTSDVIVIGDAFHRLAVNKEFWKSISSFVDEKKPIRSLMGAPTTKLNKIYHNVNKFFFSSTTSETAEKYFHILTAISLLHF